MLPRRRRALRWLARALLRRWRALAAVAATMLGGVVVTLLKPWPMKVLVDNVLSGRPLPERAAAWMAWLNLESMPVVLLTAVVLATVLLFVFGWLVALCHTLAKIAYAQRLAYELAAHSFGHLQRLSLSYHGRAPVGDLIRRVTHDTSFISKMVQSALFPALTAVLTLIGMFVVMWRMSPLLTLACVAVVPMMAAGFVLYSGRMLALSYAQQSAEGHVYSVVEQTLSAMAVVQAFAQEETSARMLRASTGSALRAAIASAGVDMRFKIAVGLATALGTATVLWLGTQQVLAGQLTIGGLLVFVAYLAAFYAPLNTIMYSSSTLQTAAGSAKRVMEVLETEEEVEERPGAVALGAIAGRLEFQAVTFGYDPGRVVLRDVSLCALPGQTVALVGATGAGKSTLVGLIPRFYDPWQGRVLIDGVDIREVQVQSLRRRIALVLQDPFLFPTSITENIAYGRPEASREEIQAAARAANAHDFIERLPDGYDSVVGERGATLSGGERQRISIARGLLKNAPILILDEPTSALDAETENLLLQALRRLMTGRTTFIIAHRLSTIRHADRIVVLQEGRIAETGTHEELMRRGRLYRRYQAMQGGSADFPGDGRRGRG
jgi:ATP-binding cassette, subfamily B, bacterial